MLSAARVAPECCGSDWLVLISSPASDRVGPGGGSPTGWRSPRLFVHAPWTCPFTGPVVIVVFVVVRVCLRHVPSEVDFARFVTSSDFFLL